MEATSSLTACGHCLAAVASSLDTNVFLILPHVEQVGCGTPVIVVWKHGQAPRHCSRYSKHQVLRVWRICEKVSCPILSSASQQAHPSKKLVSAARQPADFGNRAKPSGSLGKQATTCLGFWAFYNEIWELQQPFVIFSIRKTVTTCE